MHRNRYTPLFALLLGALLWALPQQVSGQNRLVAERAEQSQLQLEAKQAKRAHVLNPSAATEQALGSFQKLLPDLSRSDGVVPLRARRMGLYRQQRHLLVADVNPLGIETLHQMGLHRQPRLRRRLLNAR